MIDLNEVQIFTRVVECGSITAAAKRLELQKSTVSRKLAAMEARLGARLLTRTTRNIHLTEIGKSHYQQCAKIIQQWEASEHAVGLAGDEPKGSIQMLMPMELGQTLMSNLILEFLLENPAITVHAEMTNREPRMAKEGLDLFFRVGKPRDSALYARWLFSISRGLYASEAYIERYGLPETPDELKHHQCVELQTELSSGYWSLSRSTPHGKQQETIKPSGRFRVNSISSCLDAALAGFGIACLPAQRVRSTSKSHLVQVLPQWQMLDADVYALYPNRKLLPATVRYFLDFLLQRLKQKAHEGEHIGVINFEPRALP